MPSGNSEEEEENAMNEETDNAVPSDPPQGEPAFVHPSPFPADLPGDPSAFYRAAQLPVATSPEHPTPSALDRLGSCPIPKYKFPLLGFLATVYEHVSAHAATVVGK
jgi:hypothetical protein